MSQPRKFVRALPAVALSLSALATFAPPASAALSPVLTVCNEGVTGAIAPLGSPMTSTWSNSGCRSGIASTGQWFRPQWLNSRGETVTTVGSYWVGQDDAVFWFKGSPDNVVFAARGIQGPF